ncbi:MAG TPA: hypothetical protein VEG84_11230, partial [Thermoanaerobaculia bacterium]|nr:hypothetical protein [Thermoanaerobaculia bacterium]
TPTPAPAQVHEVDIRSDFFLDSVSNGPTTTVNVGDTVEWQWKEGFHSTTSGPCPPCNGDGTWNSQARSAGSKFDLAITEAMRGKQFPYFCNQHLQMMTAVLNVNP